MKTPRWMEIVDDFNENALAIGGQLRWNYDMIYSPIKWGIVFFVVSIIASILAKGTIDWLNSISNSFTCCLGYIFGMFIQWKFYAFKAKYIR